MVKLIADYLPEKFYLDKNSMPLEAEIATKVLVLMKARGFYPNVEENIKEAVWETINYLKPRVKEK